MIDVKKNRSLKKWTFGELSIRVLWGLIYPIFYLSPRPLWSFRRFLLRIFGSSIGNNVHIYPTVRVMIPWNINIGDDSSVGDGVKLYALGPITIGQRVTISQGAHLCAGTHDYLDSTMPLIKCKITIESDVWICADAFVGPNVTIGVGAILGARGVLFSDLPSKSIAWGNPAEIRKFRNIL